MSGSVDEENDVDLYSDIPNIQYDDTISNLEHTNKALEREVKGLKEKLQNAYKVQERLKSENKILGTNISSLYKTAVNEIKRKERMIAELRREKDSILFRRGRASNSLKDDGSGYQAEVEHQNFIEEVEEEEEEQEETLPYSEHEDMDQVYQQWQSESQTVPSVSSNPSTAPRTIFTIRREEKLHRLQAETSVEHQHINKGDRIMPDIVPVSNSKQAHVAEITKGTLNLPKLNPLQTKLMLLSNNTLPDPENYPFSQSDQSVRIASKNGSIIPEIPDNKQKGFSQNFTQSLVCRQTSQNVKFANNLKSKYSRVRHERSKSRTPLKTVPGEKRQRLPSHDRHSDCGKTSDNLHLRDEGAKSPEFSNHWSGKKVCSEKISKLKSKHQSLKGNSEVSSDVKHVTDPKSANESTNSITVNSRSILNESLPLRETSKGTEAGPAFEAVSIKIELDHSKNTVKSMDLLNPNTSSKSPHELVLVKSENNKLKDLKLLPNNTNVSEAISKETPTKTPSPGIKKPAIFKEGKVSLCLSSEQCEFQIPRRRTTMKLKLRTSNISPSKSKVRNVSSDAGREKNLKRRLEVSPDGPEQKKIKICASDAVDLSARGTGSSVEKKKDEATNNVKASKNCKEKFFKLIGEEKNAKEDMEEGEIIDRSPSKLGGSKTLSKQKTSDNQADAECKSESSIEPPKRRRKIVVTEGNLMGNVAVNKDLNGEIVENIHSEKVRAVTKERRKHHVKGHHSSSALKEKNEYSVGSSRGQNHKIKESMRMSVPKWRSTHISRSRHMKDPFRRSCTPILRRLSNGCERRSPSELLGGDRRVKRLRQIGNSRYEVERSRVTHSHEERSSSRHYVTEGRSHSSRNTENEHKSKLRSVCLKKFDDKSLGEKRQRPPSHDSHSDCGKSSENLHLRDEGAKSPEFSNHREDKHDSGKIAIERRNTHHTRGDVKKPFAIGTVSNVESQKSNKLVNENNSKLSLHTKSLNQKSDLNRKKHSEGIKENSSYACRKIDDRNEVEFNETNNTKNSHSSSVVGKAQPLSKQTSKLETMNALDLCSLEVKSAINDNIFENSHSKESAEQDHLVSDDSQNMKELPPTREDIYSVQSLEKENFVCSLGGIANTVELQLPQSSVNTETKSEGSCMTATNVKECTGKRGGLFGKISEGINHEKSSDPGTLKSGIEDDCSYSAKEKSADDISSSASIVPVPSTESESPVIDKNPPSGKRFVMKKRLSKSRVLGNSIPITSVNSMEEPESQSENSSVIEKTQLNDVGNLSNVSQNDTSENLGESGLPLDSRVHSRLDKFPLEESQPNNDFPASKRLVMKKRLSKSGVLGNSSIPITSVNSMEEPESKTENSSVIEKTQLNDGVGNLSNVSQNDTSENLGESGLPLDSRVHSRLDKFPLEESQTNNDFPASKRFVMKKRLSKSRVLGNSIPITSVNSMEEPESKSENSSVIEKTQLNDGVGILSNVSQNDTSENLGESGLSLDSRVHSRLDKFPLEESQTNNDFSASKRFVMKKRLSKSHVLGNSIPITSVNNMEEPESKSENSSVIEKKQLNNGVGNLSNVSQNDTSENLGKSCLPLDSQVHSRLDKFPLEESQTNNDFPASKRFVMKKRRSKSGVLGNSETHILASIKSSISSSADISKSEEREPHSFSTSKFYKQNNKSFQMSKSSEKADVSDVKYSSSSLSAYKEPLKVKETGLSLPSGAEKRTVSVDGGEKSDQVQLCSGTFPHKEISANPSLNTKSQGAIGNISERLVATPPDFRQRFAAVFQQYGQAVGIVSDDEQDLEEFDSSSSRSNDDSDSTYNPKKGQSSRTRRAVNRNKTSNRKTKS